MMAVKSLITRGDLNFSFGVVEPWGPRARADNLSDYFTNILV